MENTNSSGMDDFIHNGSMTDTAREINRLKKQVRDLSTSPINGFVQLSTNLISTNFNGDAFPTTAKTLIDLSVEFGVPPGAKAVTVRIAAKDTGSAAGLPHFYVSPNNVALSCAVICRLDGQADGLWVEANGICPCDENGDIYYSCTATGTLNVWLQITGYFI